MAAFEEDVAELYADVMDAETEYAAVAFREDTDIFLGRAEEGKTVVLKAEIRRGRTVERKREFVLAVVDSVADRFGVPRSNQKVVFTEHEGSQMMGYDRVGGEWEGSEE